MQSEKTNLSKLDSKREKSPKHLSPSVALLVVLLYIVIHQVSQHLVYNETDSMPLGFYEILPTSDTYPIQRNSAYLVCEPIGAYRFSVNYHFSHLKKGGIPLDNCPSERIFLKYAWGKPGEAMMVNTHGVSDNGILLKKSVPLRRLQFGAVLPWAKNEVIPLKQIWGGSFSPYSWDSRYYGSMRVLRKVHHLCFCFSSFSSFSSLMFLKL